MTTGRPTYDGTATGRRADGDTATGRPPHDGTATGPRPTEPCVEGWLVDLRAAGHAWDDEVRRGELSAEEAGRAERFRSPAAAVTYVRARSTVRRVLARTLGEHPSTLRIAVAPGGRPALPDHPQWHVSWSRSAEVLLVAVRRGAPVGVDVEVMRPVPSPAKVLRTVYPHTPALADLGEPEAFFSAWTLLEAAVKATGRGLARGGRDVRLHRPPGARRCALAGIRDGGTAPWCGRTDQFELPSSGRGAPAARVMTAVVTRGRSAPAVRLNTWRLPETEPPPDTAPGAGPSVPYARHAPTAPYEPNITGPKRHFTDPARNDKNSRR
ncbi:4'-phosphopantetheinyl transferase superfamily protein [Streptomyces sp. NPDC052036]|uniref:4'-phosphopantetheinyl transferase family protein n=1 Tax=unclassified Streptomyces TaxID=2593676 RepID=UPI00342F3075